MNLKSNNNFKKYVTNNMYSSEQFIIYLDK